MHFWSIIVRRANTTAMPELIQKCSLPLFITMHSYLRRIDCTYHIVGTEQYIELATIYMVWSSIIEVTQIFILWLAIYVPFSAVSFRLVHSFLLCVLFSLPNSMSISLYSSHSILFSRVVVGVCLCFGQEQCKRIIFLLLCTAAVAAIACCCLITIHP